MSAVTEIWVVTPQRDPKPARRVVALAPSADGRRAITFVSWLSPVPRAAQ